MRFKVGLILFIVCLGITSCKDKPNEILTAFGLMNHHIGNKNFNYFEQRDSLYISVKNKFPDEASHIDLLKNSSEELYQYLEQLKAESLVTIENPTDFNLLNHSTFYDDKFFKNGEITKSGNEFLLKMSTFSLIIDSTFKSQYPKETQQVLFIFNTKEAQDRNGKKHNWLSFNFEKFPMISSLAKLSQIQSDIVDAEKTILLAILTNKNEP